MLIDPKGLLHGDRVGACSDEAQLHFPRLLAASNTFGRFRMSVDWLHSEVYDSFRVKPTKDQLTGWMKEYWVNFLLFVYKAPDGSLWAQWDVPEKMLGRYRATADRNTPAPPEKELQAFRFSYAESVRMRNQKSGDIIADGFCNVPHSSKTFQNVSESSETFQNIPHHVGVGVGVNVGVGVVKDVCSEPSGSEPAVAHLLTNRHGETYPVLASSVETWKRLYPAVDVPQQLRSIEGWLIAHPERRKTAKGMLRFITGWLNEEQNKGGARAASGRSSAGNPAGERNERSAGAIRGAFDAFRPKPGGSADGADEVRLPAAGDSAGDGGDVGPGMDSSRAEVRHTGDAGGAGRTHARVTVFPSAGGAAGAYRGESATTVHGIRSAHADTGPPPYRPAG